MLGGNRQRAIELLAKVSQVPFGPSYGDLLMPFWDELRDDRRFQEIRTTAKAPGEPSR
jgi:hypothetical protein